MGYKIIGDSCMDLTEECKKNEHFELVPLTLEVDGEYIIDDETFNQQYFLNKVRQAVGCPRSACPSPEAYKKAYEGPEEMVFVVTLSEHLSGSYNSACLGKALYEEEYGTEGKQIHVFSSDSACAGEALIAFFIRDLCEEGLSFEEIVAKTDEYRYHMHTYFVLENMDFLKKNGRLTGLAALAVTVLNIKPVMGADHGVIIRKDQARGIKKALDKLCKIVVNEAVNPEIKRMSITFCNCPERARQVKEMLLSMFHVKEVYMVAAAGVSSLYAGDGGIVVSI